jgi:hypothetical protein
MSGRKKAGAVTSLLLIVDAHAMALEGGAKSRLQSKRVPENPPGRRNWRPLLVGNLSLAVLKEKRFGNENAV